MKFTSKLILPLFLCISFFSCQKKIETIPSQDKEWKNLITKNLSEWDTYLSFKHQIGYDGFAPKDSLGNLIKPIGLNNPNFSVFKTINEKEELLIKVTGEYYGCIISKQEYENYHFQLKFKWGNKKWTPRKNLLKDSGILYHSIGPHGAEHWRSWMLSQEFQIMEGHTGDYWKQASSAIDIRAYTPEFIMNPMANETQDFIPVGDNKVNPYYCLRSNNYENKTGEWNTLDLICFEDKALHIVNGKVVMILKNSRYINKNGASIPLTKGKIQIQSEAAEVYYKDIKIKNIKQLPSEFTQYY